jgi:hypothetical protein
MYSYRMRTPLAEVTLCWPLWATSLRSSWCMLEVLHAVRRIAVVQLPQEPSRRPAFFALFAGVGVLLVGLFQR